MKPYSKYRLPHISAGLKDGGNIFIGPDTKISKFRNMLKINDMDHPRDRFYLVDVNSIQNITLNGVDTAVIEDNYNQRFKGKDVTDIEVILLLQHVLSTLNSLNGLVASDDADFKDRVQNMLEITNIKISSDKCWIINSNGLIELIEDMIKRLEE